MGSIATKRILQAKEEMEFLKEICLSDLPLSELKEMLREVEAIISDPKSTKEQIANARIECGLYERHIYTKKIQKRKCQLQDLDERCMRLGTEIESVYGSEDKEMPEQICDWEQLLDDQRREVMRDMLYIFDLMKWLGPNKEDSESVQETYMKMIDKEVEILKFLLSVFGVPPADQPVLRRLRDELRELRGEMFVGIAQR